MTQGNVPGSIFDRLREIIMGNLTKFGGLLVIVSLRMGSITSVWHCLTGLFGEDELDLGIVEWFSAIADSALQSVAAMSVADAATLMAMSDRFGAEFHAAW